MVIQTNKGGNLREKEKLTFLCSHLLMPDLKQVRQPHDPETFLVLGIYNK